jgi:cytoskeletal protein RodZ
MSEKTKVPLIKLQAIEDDNIAYFKEELTYLKFYVRYYFNALHLNFDDYKDVFNATIDTYTETAQLIKTQEMRDLHQRVANGANKQLQKANVSVRKRPQKAIRSDLAFISMIVVGLLIVLSLLFVFFQSILPILAQDRDNKQVIVIPNPIEHKKDEVDEPAEEPEDPIVFTVVKSATRDKNGQLTNYNVSGYTEGDTVTIEVEVVSTKSWISSKVDGVSTVNPPRRDYLRGEIYTLIVTAKPGSLIEVYIGNLNRQILRINGSVVVMDAQLLTDRVSSSFFFRFVEETP